MSISPPNTQTKQHKIMKEKATTGEGEYRKFYSCNSINVTQSFIHVYSIKFLFKAAVNYLRIKNSGSHMLKE